MNNGFYKNDNGQLSYAPNFVIFPDGPELIIQHKDNYTYPIYDWYYFDSEEDAKTFFGIE
jgi:hypothetical protein